MKSIVIGVTMSLAIAIGQARAHGREAHVPTKGVRVALAGDHVIPNIPGKSLRTVLVSFDPGGSNESHRHAGSAFIYAYVLEGALRTQIEGEPPRVYRAGEHFVEAPGAHHLPTINVSRTKPAKLLAVFVVDTNDTQLTKPDLSTNRGD